MVERRGLPQFVRAKHGGGALCAARRRRRRLTHFALALALGCTGIVATIAAPPLPRLVWNASASAPVGLYAVAPGSGVLRGDMVIARTPISVRALAARRHYIPANVPLVKRVAGVAGDRICAVGSAIIRNGRVLATRRTVDSLGRPLPWWTGCRTLGSGALFLLMAESPDSFDGRYFGPMRRADIIGKATLLWRE